MPSASSHGSDPNTEWEELPPPFAPVLPADPPWSPRFVVWPGLTTGSGPEA